MLSDAECARAYKKVRGNDGERFNAARMVCAGDVNGRAPLSSGCNGDSGGPLYAEGPVLLGIVSWGSVKCGADGTPSVFAQADRYSELHRRPGPGLGCRRPTAAATVKRSKGRLRCSPPVYTERVDKLAYTWLDGGRTVGSGRTFKTSSPPSAGDLPDRGEQRRRILDRALGTVLVRERAQGEAAATALGLAAS